MPSSASPTLPSWAFVIPAAVANERVWLAIYAQQGDDASSPWVYWDPGSGADGAFVAFAPTDDGMDTSVLIDATPDGPYTAPVTTTLTLPGDTTLRSGVAVLFVGSSPAGVPVAQGVPGSPTPTTNPDDVFALFEFTFQVASGGNTLDVDISNVDQVALSFTVESDPAPFPLGTVGSTVPRSDLFARFAAAFPSSSPFNECLAYGHGTGSTSGAQVRLLAPQDVLQQVAAPPTPTLTVPGGAVQKPEPFADYTYFYLASEVSAAGETAPSPAVFGGFLLNSVGDVSASEITVGWKAGVGPPVPANPISTGINLYRASGPAVNANPTPPTPPTDLADYGLLTTLAVTEGEVGQTPTFVDSQTAVGAQQPKTSSYGFSALSTWFDDVLGDVFALGSTFALYQFNQNDGTPGTLWTGKVLDVTPKTGEPITAMTYVDDAGTPGTIDAAWTWGDGTQTYRVLQLVGNAYDPTDYSDTAIMNESGLTAGEYQGAVVNIYAPFFTANTGGTSMTLGGTAYTLPPPPPWLDNATNGPSQMVFGCAGTFATPNDPDSVAQESAFPVLAVNALTNLENVLVSAINRGVASLGAQQFTSLYTFSTAPAPATGGALAPGTYTYYLSGTLNDGTETALSWPQTITLAAPSDAVTLAWLPQETALYAQANVYRQTATGPITLVGTVANTAASQATSFTDLGKPPPTPGDGPFPFYPSWDDPTAPGFVASNLFSAFLHQNLSASPDGISLNGLVYGFPFDDQGDFSTNINYGTALPTTITFTLSG